MEGTRSNLELKYRIEAETFSGKKFSRVRFHNGLTDKTHVVEKNIQFRARNATEECFQETVFVKVSSLFLWLLYLFGLLGVASLINPLCCFSCIFTRRMPDKLIGFRCRKEHGTSRRPSNSA